MLGKKEFFISTLLLFFFHVAAHKADNQPLRLGPVEKESSRGSSWSHDPANSATREVKLLHPFGDKPADDNIAHKRYEFIGKRSPYEFLGKRQYEFLGKRNIHDFQGKRGQNKLVEKRSPYEFLGKKTPYEFLEKRNSYEFLGKRVPYEFLGKRSPIYKLLGKRSSYEFLGKRSPGYEFLGKRTPYEFVIKRSPGYEFLGKRSPYEFLGKRSQGNKFLERRSYEFLGKRNKMAGQEESLSTEKRALVDFYGKRVQLPYEFVGKRFFGGEWARVKGNVKTRVPYDSSSSDADKGRLYTQWPGTYGAQSLGQQLQGLKNKHISTLIHILSNGTSPRKEDMGKVRN